jgi:hypothetical protein
VCASHLLPTPPFHWLQGSIYVSTPDPAAANYYTQSVFMSGLSAPGELCGVRDGKLFYISLNGASESWCYWGCLAREDEGASNGAAPPVHTRCCKQAASNCPCDGC